MQVFLSIPTDRQPFSAGMFAVVLAHLTAVYQEILDHQVSIGRAVEFEEGMPNAQLVLDELVKVANASVAGGPEFEHLQVEQLAAPLLADAAASSPLLIVDIRRQNPIEITLAGVGSAIAVAVILSGGSFQFLGMKAKLPPLGKGIAALRKSLAWTRHNPSNTAPERQVLSAKGASKKGGLALPKPEAKPKPKPTVKSASGSKPKSGSEVSAKLPSKSRATSVPRKRT